MKYSHKDLEIYASYLKAFCSLSKLFSESDKPYLEYRAMENIYCKSFKAINLAREDSAFDAKIGATGIGLKTFGFPSSSKVEKVAEFNKNAHELKNLSGKSLAKELAILRNRRIEVAKNLHKLDSAIYHCIGRKKDKLLIFEIPYDAISIDDIKDIKNTNASLYFRDNVKEYRFNFSKSVLMQKFSFDESNLLYELDIKVFKDPYEALLRLFDTISAENLEHKVSYDFVVLPLYSTRDGRVPEKSQLNQWNALGRKRDYGEVYIPIPSKIHKLKKDFFPDRDKVFSLKVPDGRVLKAKVCQDGSKALMTNPNNALEEWLLRQVFSLKEGELLTKEKLDKSGFDSVIIEKLDVESFSITLASLGSYEEFLLEQESSLRDV
ncbi:MAG: restriction endonuclease [Campylobacterales bacterium]